MKSSQLSDENNAIWNDISQEIEQIRDGIFESINKIIRAHLNFGFETIEHNINPRIEDILLSLTVIGVLLESILAANNLDYSETRIILNSKQMILCIERVALALKNECREEYGLAIDMMRKQAQF